jgi:hypothetical protein
MPPQDTDTQTEDGPPGTPPFEAPPPSGEPDGPGAEEPRPYAVRVVSALIAVVLVLGAGWHLAMVFLHVAPSNTISQEYGSEVDDWIYPYFEQNWKLFAPNPVQENTHVEVQTRTKAKDGTVTEGGWTDLTADDVAQIRHNPFPSKADQNMLRRAWEYYSGSHGEDERRLDTRGELAEDYLRRIAVRRLQDTGRADGLTSVRLRAVTRGIPAPGTQNAPEPTIRELGWWETQTDDFR